MTIAGVGVSHGFPGKMAAKLPAIARSVARAVSEGHGNADDPGKSLSGMVTLMEVAL